MEDNKVTLTDTEVEVLTKAVEGEESPSRDALMEAKQKELSEKVNNVKETVNVYTLPNGRRLPILDEDDVDDKEYQRLMDMSFEELMEDDSIKAIDIDSSTLDISQDSVEAVLSTMFEDYKGFSIEDFNTIQTLVRRVANGEEFSYYASMPESVKTLITTMMVTAGAVPSKNIKESRNFIAFGLLKDIADSAVMQSAIFDFNKVIKATAKKTADEIRQDDYWWKIRQYFLEVLPSRIEKFTSEGKMDVVKRLESAKSAYTESYTYTDMKEVYLKGKLKVKKIEIEKFKRTMQDFNMLYRKSSNTIQDIAQIVPVLDAHTAEDITLDTIKKFVVIFIKYVFYKHFDPNNFYDHTYMYFFIYNILCIANYNHNNDKDVKFHFQLISNINDFMHLIQNQNK